VAELSAERVVSGERGTFFGMQYLIPYVEEWPRTNLGKVRGLGESLPEERTRSRAGVPRSASAPPIDSRV